MDHSQDITNKEKESIFQTNVSIDSLSRDKVLLKCKETLEKMQFELDEEHQLNQNLKEKNDDLMNQLHIKDSDLQEAYKQFDLINCEYQRELDKVNNLQREVCLMKETNAKLHIYENKHNVIRDKLTQASTINNELKNKIKKLEDGLKKRDELVEYWNETINDIDYKLTRSEDEKKGLASEKLMTIDMINELTKIVKEKYEGAKSLSPVSTISNSKRNLDKDDSCSDKANQVLTKLNFLKRMLLELFEILEERKNEVGLKYMDLENQLELFKKDFAGKVDRSDYELVRRELDHKKADLDKFKTIMDEHTQMIHSYKELIQEQKLKISEMDDEHHDFQNKTSQLDKDNKDLQDLLKIYEQKIAGSEYQFPETKNNSNNQQDRHNEEFNDTGLVIASFENQLKEKSAQIKYQQSVISKLKEKLEVSEMLRNEKESTVLT